MKKLILSFPIIMLCLGGPTLVQSAQPMPCSFDDIESGAQTIHPAFALCDTHAFNAMFTNGNPTAEDEKRHMDEIIRLKTEVITLQMKRHYDTLDTLLRRFEVQLQRAMQTNYTDASAGPRVDRNSGSLTDRRGNIFFAGAQDCSSIFQEAQRLECIQNNARLVRSAPVGEARRQLEHDLRTLNLIDSQGTLTTTNDAQGMPTPSPVQHCANIRNANQQAVINCANQLGIHANSLTNRQQNRSGGMDMQQMMRMMGGG